MIALWLATQFLLGWEFPRTYAPAPTYFLLTVTNVADGTADHLQVPPSSKAACGTGPDVTDDTFCTLWPGCPPDGVYVITVQAADGEQLSTASELMVCHFSSTAPCQCLPVETHAPPQVETAVAPVTVPLAAVSPLPPLQPISPAQPPPTLAPVAAFPALPAVPA